MVRHSTARQKFCSYKTEESLQVEPQSNSNFYGSARRGTTYKTGLSMTGNFFPIGYDSMGFEMSKPHLRAELENDLKWLVCSNVQIIVNDLFIQLLSVVWCPRHQ